MQGGSLVILPCLTGKQLLHLGFEDVPCRNLLQRGQSYTKAKLTGTNWLESCGGCCTARKLCSNLSPIKANLRLMRRSRRLCTDPCPIVFLSQVGLWHPAAPMFYEDLKEYLNWYDTRKDLKLPADAPVIGLVLQRSHLVTGDEGHYAGE